MKCKWMAMAMLVATTVMAEPLRVCTTVPDLGDLVRVVGGDAVEVTSFAEGVEDPHFVEARPGFVKALSRADVFVQVGMELELGWAGLLLQGARNGKLAPGKPGFIDASTVITPLDVPVRVDRSMGDVHAAGSPHYLLDPANGRRVAGLLAERLAVLQPERAAYFQERLAAFARDLDAREQAWEAALAPHRGVRYVADHDMWGYFGARYGLVEAGFLEPKPGLQPTTRHLEEVIGVIQKQHVPIVIASPYYDPRHAQFVRQHTGAAIVPLAHQVGSREGAGTYLDMVDYNVRTLAQALGH